MRKVFFISLTSYQLFISDCYARYISKYFKDISTVIFYSGPPHQKIKEDGRYRIIDIKDLNTSKVKRFCRRLIWGRFYCFNPIRKIVQNDDKTYLFVFNDTDPVTSKLINEVSGGNDNVITLIEEGVGVYETSDVTVNKLKRAVRFFVTWIMGSPMQYRAVGDNKLIDNAIVENTDLYRELSKSAGQNILSMSKKDIFGIQSDFIKRINIGSMETMKYDVLYLGQTFDEFGELNYFEDRFLTILFSVIKKMGKKCIIKPHPLDKYCKYSKYEMEFDNIKVIDGFMASLPMECMTSLISFNVLVAFNSSAGINLANSYKDIRAVFTFDMPESEKLYEIWSNGYAELNREAFRNEFNNIYVPRSINELEEDLNIEDRTNSVSKICENSKIKLSEMDILFKNQV